MDKFELRDNQQGFTLLHQLLSDTSRTLPENMLSALRRFVIRLRLDDMAANRPRRVCLCGSTRFSDAYQKANTQETLNGNIVLTIGCDMKSDADLFADKSESELFIIKQRLDQLHLRKIDLADEVLILNVGGYVGESTKREIAYAKQQGKGIRWLEPDKALTIIALQEIP